MIINGTKTIYEIIKESGYSFRYVSTKLGISRNSLYHKLKSTEISPEFIISIGKIIHYDFIEEIPNLKNYLKEKGNNCFKELSEKQNIINERKYSDLMFQYNSLLDFMITLSNDHNLKDLKENINKFIKERNI